MSVSDNPIRIHVVRQSAHTSERDDDDLEPDSPVDRYTTPDSEIDAGLTLAHPHSHLLPTPPKLRPDPLRSSTDPPSAAPLPSYFNTPRPTTTPRNRSPYSRSHLRSRSSGAALSAPAMTRAHSSPAMHSSPRTLELTTPSTASLSPSSPMRSPARLPSPLRAENENNSYNPPPRSPSWYESPIGGSGIESIQEDSELDITPRQALPMPAAMPFMRSSSLRRRPASPLHAVTNASAPTSCPGSYIDGTHNISTVSSGSSSPSLGPQRYNEAYPPLHHYASSSSFSSIPSTPTSQRSRSPSITSLETIEDDPDLETMAIEAERIEKLKLAAERAERAERGEDTDDNPRRRGSLDVPRGFGFSRGGSRERKRWSVCGGERRADLDLETIWED